MLDNTLKEANRILKAVKPLLDKKIAMSLEPYQNGREHGLSISTWGRSSKGLHHRRVSFAVYRRSDSLVVYFGDSYKFESNNIPNNEIYERAKMFKPDDYNAAAKFIAQFLNTPDKR